jgi:hypothetical protein
MEANSHSANKQQPKTNIMEDKNLYTRAAKRIKCLEINLRNVQNLYEKNFEIM